MKDGSRGVARWWIAGGLILAAAYLLCTAILHAWLTAAPSSRPPEYHRAWCYRFALASISSFALAIVVIWKMRPSRRV